MAVRSKKKSITIDDLALMVARGFGVQDKKFSKEFERINKRFEQQEVWINKRFEQQEVWLNKRLYEQEQRFNKRFEELDKKYENIMNSIDALTKNLEIYYHEHLSLGVKVDRHEDWIKQIAEKVGVKLLVH